MIDWGEIQWTELDNTGLIATSDYDDIDWGEIQFSELDWSATADAGVIDWGEVQWTELDGPDIREVKWSAVQFSELDASDIVEIRNLIASSKISDIKIGNNTSENISGDLLNNQLFGAGGSDSLDGKLGNDFLMACSGEVSGGRGEKDALTGGGGNDVFAIGYDSGILYNDGVLSNAGRNDYVLITDFKVGQDKLQLDGVASNYYVAASGVTGVAGSGIWAEQGQVDELIAIVRSADSTQLTSTNLINTAMFV